jgi:Mycoplasma protein of unknown function, DUF285
MRRIGRKLVYFGVSLAVIFAVVVALVCVKIPSKRHNDYTLYEKGVDTNNTGKEAYTNTTGSAPGSGAYTNSTGSGVHIYATFENSVSLRSAVDSFLDDDPASHATLVAKYGAIAEWNVSLIDDFGELFSYHRNTKAVLFRENLSAWNLQQARNTSHMFHGAALVNFDVSDWQMNGVVLLKYMFANATAFQGQGLSKWNMSSGESLEVSDELIS